MGWADCGTDSKGRKIGYAFSARCDHPGCKAKIDRGLGHACGGMHGENGDDCEGYFCGNHLHFRHSPTEERSVQLCAKCCDRLDAYQREEYQRVLAETIGALDEDADVEALRVAAFNAKRAIYELLVAWDDLEDVPLDKRYMHAADYKRLSTLRAFYSGEAPLEVPVEAHTEA